MEIFMKKTIIKRLVVILVFTMPLFSCNNTEPEEVIKPEFENNGLLPLKVGNYWKYKVEFLKSDGSFFYDGLPFEIRINRQTVKNEMVPYYSRVYVDQNGKADTLEWLFRNKSDGLYLLGGRAKRDSLFTSTLYLKFPVTKGEFWFFQGIVYNNYIEKFELNSSFKYTCVSTDSTFQTPIGTFSCIVFHHREKQAYDVLEEIDVYEFYTKQLGLIGIIVNGFDPIFHKTNPSYPKKKIILTQTNVL